MGIREALESVINNNVPVQVERCKVKSVNFDNNTMDCTPLNENADYLGVSLNTKSESLGVIQYPKEKSIVLVGLVGNDANEAFMISCSEVESIKIIIADSFELTVDKDGVVDIKADKISINGGKNDGIIIISKLKAEIEKLNQVVKVLVNVLLTAVPIPQDGGKSIATQLNTALKTLPLADLSKITNDDFKH